MAATMHLDSMHQPYNGFLSCFKGIDHHANQKAPKYV